jgi:hypothetical protein
MQTIMIRIMGIVLAAMLLVPALAAQQSIKAPDFDAGPWHFKIRCLTKTAKRMLSFKW